MHIDRFSTADHLTGKTRTYEAVKEVVLRAGRFSTFEAAEDSYTFSRLLQDPEVEKVEMEYPWIGVRRRELPPAADAADPQVTK